MSVSVKKGIDLYINVDGPKCNIVSISGGNVVDYLVEDFSNEYSVGDILIGRVKKKAVNLSSFFITFNKGVDGFMHFSDLCDRTLTLNGLCSDLMSGKDEKVSTYEIDIREKERVIFDYNYTVSFINEGDLFLAQVIKEPIFNKGPRLSGRITLSGDFLILVIFDDSIHISKKISGAKKREKMLDILKDIKDELKLNNFGIILRTSAETFINFDDPKSARQLLLDDLIVLLKKWSECINKIKKCTVGDKIFNGNTNLLTVIQGKLKDNIKNIWVDDKDIFNEIKDGLTDVVKDSCNLKLYKNNLVPLFVYKNIDDKLVKLFNKIVKFADGCYLIIEVTEAMNVIDVNSGSLLEKYEDQEELSLNVNLLAAEEIVKQIFLRDMGGLISIDFIDMKLQKNKNLVYEKMKELLYDDKSSNFILPLSKFNVMQVTRQRVRPIQKIDFSDKCLTCLGTGETNSCLSIADILESELIVFLKDTKYYRLSIFLNPLLYAYFSYGIFSKRFKWGLKFWKSIKLYKDSMCSINILKIYNSGNLIKEIAVKTK